tara:strand:+ start:2687 stop:3430 length:744 start_codon:yes stop_codon:yes gene_type:complete
MNLELKNEKNYKLILEISSIDIFKKYQDIIEEYFDKYTFYFVDETYNKYVKVKGINSITNIFKIILYNTNNIELVCHHTRKAVTYYISFIEQISNSSNNYLNLNVNDAMMFVYNKTIFDLIRNADKKESIKIQNVDTLISLFNYGLLHIIDSKKEYKFVKEYISIIYNNKKYKTELIIKDYLTIIELYKNLIDFNKEKHNNDITIDVFKDINIFVKTLQSKRQIHFDKIQQKLKTTTNCYNVKIILN